MTRLRQWLRRTRTARRRWSVTLPVVLALVVGDAPGLPAQVTDSVRKKVPSHPDSAHAAVPTLISILRDTTARASKARTLDRGATRLRPPLTPRRAFLYSLALPGLGQARLDRGGTGVFFASIEMGAVVMVHRSSVERGEVRRYRADSVPADFTVQADGTIKSSAVMPNRFTSDLDHTRRLHVEDWIAAMAFNHLLSGADAFVAAQLWEVPRLSLTPVTGGVMLVATIRW